MEAKVKLITLNTWGGRAMHPLMHFFRQRAPETDVFCLQEVFDADQAALEERHPDEHVRGDLLAKLRAELKDFDGFFARFNDNPLRQSLAIFVRKTVKIRAVGDNVVYIPKKPRETGSRVLSARKLQYVILEINGYPCLVSNFHGLWNGGPKTDTPERIAQSNNVKTFLDSHHCVKVLCGDFNLLPETQSVRILEQGMCNLVRENSVQGTRTVLYRHYDNPNEPNFADYVFVSPEVRVRDFEVLPDIVSDHSPLYLEFGISQGAQTIK